MAWLDVHDHDHEVCLSTISLGEIVKGIELMSFGKRRKEIETWFARLERWAGGRLFGFEVGYFHIVLALFRMSGDPRFIPASEWNFSQRLRLAFLCLIIWVSMTVAAPNVHDTMRKKCTRGSKFGLLGDLVCVASAGFRARIA